MDLHSRLRAIVEPLPEGASVTLPVEVLRAWLAGGGEERTGDYTVEEVGAILGRAPSTIRNWIGQGRLQAYKLGREWRITADAIRELRERDLPGDRGRRSGVDGPLSQYRAHLQGRP